MDNLWVVLAFLMSASCSVQFSWQCVGFRLSAGCYIPGSLWFNYKISISSFSDKVRTSQGWCSDAKRKQITWASFLGIHSVHVEIFHQFCIIAKECNKELLQLKAMQGIFSRYTITRKLLCHFVHYLIKAWYWIRTLNTPILNTLLFHPKFPFHHLIHFAPVFNIGKLTTHNRYLKFTVNAFSCVVQWETCFQFG